MALEIVDTIAAHTVEIGDIIHLDGETATVTNVEDRGDTIFFTYLDSFEDEATGAVSADAKIDLFVNVNEEDEDF